VGVRALHAFSVEYIGNSKITELFC